jgi:hypothetical protein
MHKFPHKSVGAAQSVVPPSQVLPEYFVVTEIENEGLADSVGRAEYFVQSPSAAVTKEVLPAENLVPPVERNKS